MAETLDTFFTALCRRMGWEATAWRINVLKMMAQMEGYPSVIQLEQTWNPLDTMHPAGAVGNWNAAGVKIYPDLAAGVEATARTLEQSNFTNLRETLRTQQVNQGTAADLQLWGWNSPNLRNTILSAMTGGATMTNGTFDPGAVSPWEREYGVSGLAQAGQGTAASDVIPWMTGFFRDKTYTLESGATLTKTAAQQASEEFADDPMKWISLWRSETGQEGAVTKAEEANIAYTRALAQEVIETLGGNTYEQGRQRILDQMDEKHWTAEQAISEFNAFMSAALEAGKRAETVYGEEMKRAVWTTPTEHYPGTGPGGARAQFGEKYGVPYTSSPGIAVETLPNLQDMYGQWHQQMGISQQAPPTQGGWSGQGAPQGQGWNASRQFLQRMNLRSGVQQGAPQGAGF